MEQVRRAEYAKLRLVSLSAKGTACTSLQAAAMDLAFYVETGYISIESALAQWAARN